LNGKITKRFIKIRINQYLGGNKMSDRNEVQPIDGYVRNLLEHTKERYNLNIDLDKPTRGQRLEAALAMQDEANGFYSMEIMVGRRVSSSEQLAQMFAMLKLAETMGPPNPERFYEGFAHQYHPKEE
jgi:hypothetical protein